MFAQNYLLALKFIRETERDLENHLESGLSALEEYERLIAELTEIDGGPQFSNEKTPVKIERHLLSAHVLSGPPKNEMTIKTDGEQNKGPSHAITPA